MLFNEPKLLKSPRAACAASERLSFSALQRAEIAEMALLYKALRLQSRFSALQRAEIAEMMSEYVDQISVYGFSALQRAEIAEIGSTGYR